MSPRKGRSQLKGTGASPSPKKIILNVNTQPSADKVESCKEGSMDSTKSSCRASSKSLEERGYFRDSRAPSPPPNLAASAAEPSSPSKRRIRSDVLPPRAKKSKSSSEESSITDSLAIQSLETDKSSVSSMSLDETIESQDQTPTRKAKLTSSINGPTQSKGSGEHNIQLLLEDNATWSFEHPEKADWAMNPGSKSTMEIDSYTTEQTESYEVSDNTEGARNVIISQAEKHMTKIFKYKLESKQAEINEMREEVSRIRQHYNTIVASNNADISGLLNSLEYDIRAKEDNNAKERARNSQKQERMELLNMIPKISQVEVMDGQWELEMIHDRKRYYIDVGSDGIDEFVKAPYSEQRYVDLARHILYVARPEDVQFHGCHSSDSVSKFESLSDFNFDSLSSIKENGPCWGDYKAIGAALWLISRYLLHDRRETLRCLAAHPYYQQAKQVQTKIKQELVFFFDRLFTSKMGQFYHIQNIPVDGALLRLGCDSTFRNEDSLDCGGLDESTAVEDNMETFVELMFQINPSEAGTTDTENETTEPLSPQSVDRISESQEGQPNVTMPTLTPNTNVKRASRFTQSEVDEYKVLTKTGLGKESLEAQVAECNGPGGPKTPENEADTSNTEDEVSVKNCNLSINSEMEDVSLE